MVFTSACRICLKYGEGHGRLGEFGRQAVTKRVQAGTVINPELPQEGLQRVLTPAYVGSLLTQLNR